MELHTSLSTFHVEHMKMAMSRARPTTMLSYAIHEAFRCMKVHQII